MNIVFTKCNLYVLLFECLLFIYEACSCAHIAYFILIRVITHAVLAAIAALFFVFIGTI